MFCIKELKNYENFKYMIDFCTDLDLCLFNKQENKIEAKILIDLDNNFVLINKRGEEIAIFNNLKEALQTLWELKNA